MKKIVILTYCMTRIDYLHTCVYIINEKNTIYHDYEISQTKIQEIQFNQNINFNFSD